MKTWLNRFVTTALFVGIFHVLVVSAKQKPQQEPALEFLKKGQDLTDIRAAGSPPFRLRARVEAAPVELLKGALHGTLVLNWFSPGEWREEIAFPDFTQVRIASQGKLWTTRDPPFEPLRAYQAEKLMDLRSAWTLRTDESAEAPKERKGGGTAARCVDVRVSLGLRRKLCADAISLVPLTIMPVYHTMDSGEYSGYAPWGDKQFPRLIRGYEGKKLVIELRVDELGSNSEPAAPLLSIPSGAVDWDWCDAAVPAKQLNSVGPHYPEAAKRNGQEGLVSVYAVISTDGRPESLRVVRSAGADFDAATLAVLPLWRFRPAMCGGNPIPTEEVIEVRYVLDR